VERLLCSSLPPRSPVRSQPPLPISLLFTITQLRLFLFCRDFAEDENV
jgi:hypothetical protein